ncbi:DUF2959 domain-containing protein [Vibrio aestuarianus subsp. cardii]|nr:DUF2959 domain-containing protein [Vibrio aestuarianus subsp. cardii]
MPYLLAVLVSIFTLTGCQSAYYSAMEQVGYHKRDIMVDRVEDAKTSQQDAQQEFTSALEALSVLTNFNGGELEEVYNQINDKYQDSEQAAQEVSNRIAAIEDVSDALFDEWQSELELYTSSKLKRASQQKLKKTKASYQTMLSAMKRAEQKMTPVLNTLRDNTLYLKHNLNASAIGSMQGEFISLEQDIPNQLEDAGLRT